MICFDVPNNQIKRKHLSNAIIELWAAKENIVFGTFVINDFN
jgi:hypothetical protein